MTIKREALVKWLEYWKEDVENDSMFPCCQAAIISELDQMIMVAKTPFIEISQDNKGWMEY